MFKRTVVAWIICLWAANAMAAGAYDPALKYRTVTSERFAVHYPPGARNLGLRVSRLAEEILLRDAALFGFMPEGPIDIVMVDNTDEANGFAQVLPKNTIHIYLSAPTELAGLSSYEDWLRILLTHEIAHICDLDQSWGFTRALRTVFGKYVQWNGYTPQFLSEGVAVYTETRLTETGRGRSSYVEMMLRMAALDDRFLHIDQANVFFPDWPGGNVAYFYGGRFHLWLADQFGRDKVANLHHTLAAQWIPYVYYFGAHMALGDSLPSLWNQWRQDELTYAQEVTCRRAAIRSDALDPADFPWPRPDRRALRAGGRLHYLFALESRGRCHGAPHQPRWQRRRLPGTANLQLALQFLARWPGAVLRPRGHQRPLR